MINDNYKKTVEKDYRIMLKSPICFLIKFFGSVWVTRNLKKMHDIKIKDKYPTAESTLNMIHSHPVIQALWSIEKLAISLIQRKTKSIPITKDFVLLILLARDIFVMKDFLPKNYASHIKNRYYSARQELFVGASNKIVGNDVSFMDRYITGEEKSYDLHLQNSEGQIISIECKTRLGRDDERQALHNVLALFAPKIIQALEKNNYHYSILIHSSITPTADPLLRNIPDIIQSIKNGISQIKIANGKYTINLKKLCDPGGGIQKQVIDDINSKYSYVIKTGGPVKSVKIIIPQYYDIYNPFIVGVSLERLQKESRDPLKSSLRSANKQLANKGDSFGVVYFQYNEFDADILEKCIKRLDGDVLSYSNIYAVILYAKQEGVTKVKLQKDVKTYIKILERVWINKKYKGVQSVKNLVGINASFELYIKACSFLISNNDVKCLTNIYKEIGILK